MKIETMKKVIFLFIVIFPSICSSQRNSWDGYFNYGINPHQGCRMLNIFVNIIYDVHPDTNNVFTLTDWPAVTNPALEGVNNAGIPNYLLDFCDTLYNVNCLHGTLTRLYGESSFNSLQLTGDFVVVNVRESSILQIGDFGQLNICKAAINIINENGGLQTLYGHNSLSDYTNYDTNHIAFCNVLIRNITRAYGELNQGDGHGGHLTSNLLIGNKFVSSNDGTLQCVGSGNFADNPTSIVVHEISHSLFGSNHFHTSGGNHRGSGCPMSFLNIQNGYGLMGAANSSLVGCNGYERWRMHWKHPQAADYISAHNPENTQSVVSDISYESGNISFRLRDFVTYGDAVRIKLPYKDSETSSNQYIWLENHAVGYNEKLDFLQYSNTADCRHSGKAGIYAYYQVGRDELSGHYYVVYDTLNRDNLKIIPAEGYFDYVLEHDTFQYACVSYQPQYFAVRQDASNPLMGGQDQAYFLFPKEVDNYLVRSAEYSVFRKIVGDEAYDNLSLMGDTLDAFTTATKINLGTNPSTCNTVTCHSKNDSDISTALIHSSLPYLDTRTVYLSGLSIEMIPQLNSHDFIVNIRWDDYDIDNDVRWTGTIALKETAHLTQGRTITLAQNRTVAQPNRDAETGFFAKATLLTCERGSFFHQDTNSEVWLTEGSTLTVDSGSRYILEKGARITVGAGCTLIVDRGADFRLLQDAKVEIDSGGRLITDDSLLFRRNARIIVRPGGKLVVDGGVLTSACDGEMWQGIVVEGHAIQPQSPTNQGVVELKNGAVIENAVLGLDVKSGGIVTAEDATFRNCSTSVSFVPYAAAQLHGGIINNASHFLQCHFLTDGGNHFPEHGIGSNTHLHLWGVNGIGIKGCTFANTTGGQSGSRGYGIRAEDAGFNIDTYCPGGIFLSDCTCEPSDATYSTFQGFDKAVEANTTGNQYAVRINQARFTGNGTGVSINGNNYTTVTRCDFDLTQVPAGCVTTTGLRLSGCTGFLVEENSFHRTAGGMLPSTTGISVADAGISANSIYRNQFSNLTNGVYVTGSNGALKSGLRITCGAFSGNARDIHLASGATVARSFGSSLMGADNDFSHTSASSIYCAGGQNLNYYYSPATNHAPYNPSLSVTAYATATANGCRSTLCDNGPMQLPRDLSSADTHSLLSDSHGNASLSADRNIRLAMGDTVLDLDLLADWYEAVSEPSAKYALAETRFQQNTDNASVFSTIETEYLATDEDKSEYDNYRAFDALKKALALSSDGQSADWPSATPGQIAELQRIAEARTGRSSVMAQGVLCFFFDLCSDDFLESEQTTDTRSAEAPSIQPSGSGLIVSPNPTEGVLRVEGDGDIASVELYDTFGRLLLTRQCDGPLCILDIAGLNDGAYLLKVRFANGTINSCKVVKK